MKHPAEHIFAHTPESLADWCKSHGMPQFRAKQILEWVYRKGIIDPDAMSNLSKTDRATLKNEMTFLSGDLLTEQTATDQTRKLLIEWSDAPTAANNPLKIAPGSRTDRQTECVMIPSEDPTKIRRTACISSQVGCPVGCTFCASGLGGLDGNLSSGRIVEQVWRLSRTIATDAGHDIYTETTPRITNVVFMGMGEPLANLAAVVPAVRAIAAPWGMGISARKITISTVGLPKAIEKLADQLDLPVTLALSLHAPTDNLRRSLIPWAEYTTIPDLLRACQAWFKKTGREITLEYILLGGVNDQPEHARDLASLAKTLRANVNLIRYNEVEPLEFKRPEQGDVLAFQRTLRDRHINAHIRASRGRDIAAACGQLRHEHAANDQPSAKSVS